jgi:hypothetical protein
MYLRFSLLFFVFLMWSCSPRLQSPSTTFDISLSPSKPSYDSLFYWAFHPQRDHAKQLLPKNYSDTLFDHSPVIDVFYIHPTSYHSGDNWNASLQDSSLNVSRTDYLLQNQASVFAGLTRLYAPYYRQMHIDSYTDLSNGYPAFHLAYSDVRSAFLQYWKYWNNGRPFIIAGHSQGTNHAERLIKEVILSREKMFKQLKIAYLLGMPITTISDEFMPCEEESQVDCFVSWRSFRSGFYPSNPIGDSIVSVNPIHWKTNNIQSDYTNHQGILFPNGKLKYPQSLSVKNHQGMLWIERPKGLILRQYKRDDYHVADINLFWLNIRENLRLRLSNL